MQPLPPGEVWYCWKEYVSVPAAVEGQPAEPPRLLTPWGDPQEYEWPMDWLFKNPDEALAAKNEHAPEEDWVLVRLTLQPVAPGA